MSEQQPARGAQGGAEGLRVRVMRNPGQDRATKRWLVQCDYCGGGDFFAGLFAPVGIKGWTSTWRAAQDYAHHHAIEHEKTRCPTCLHVPTEPLPERTNA